MNFDDIEVRVNKPYPEIEDTIEDKTTVGILKNLAMSRMGELNCILQYEYDATVSESAQEDIAEIIGEISVVEMTHLDLLMRAITDFGGLPKYEDAQGNMFATSQVHYSTKLKDILDHNIELEKYAIKQYRDAEIRVRNESLKMLFERIIEDEERHIKIFEKIKTTVQFFSI